MHRTQPTLLPSITQPNPMSSTSGSEEQEQDFSALLKEQKPVGTFLLDDKLEHQFRNALRLRTPEIIEYLSSTPVLTDLMDALLNEEDRTVHDASEAVGILLANLDTVVDTIVSSNGEKDHLATLFSYLDREKHQPRRVYFFLRVMSFLFQNRSPEMFSYVINHSQPLVSRLVYHIRSPHILQLVLNMLAVERQMKEFGVEICAWSEKSELIPVVVEALRTQPEENLESVQKFFSEVCLSYPVDSAFVKNILLVGDSALIRTVIELMENKNTASDAVKLLDQVVLVIMNDNQGDLEFFQMVRERLLVHKEKFQGLITSNSLLTALAGVKLIQALVKHKFVDLMDGAPLSCIDLMMKFPWSNVIHRVISDTFVYIIAHPKDLLLSKIFPESNSLVDKIIDTFASTTNLTVGYHGHLRIIANALKTCRHPTIVQYLAEHKRWNDFLQELEKMNNLNVSFRQAETQRQEQARKELNNVQVVSLDTTELAQANVDLTSMQVTTRAPWLSNEVQETSAPIAIPVNGAYGASQQEETEKNESEKSSQEDVEQKSDNGTTGDVHPTAESDQQAGEGKKIENGVSGDTHTPVDGAQQETAKNEADKADTCAQQTNS